MLNVSILLPADRSRCGTLSVYDACGTTLLKVMSVAGRSSSVLARRHGNQTRNPLLLWGDAPSGVYRIARFIPPTNVILHISRFGAHGIIVLDAVSGDAALAEANGRYRQFIHGGEAGPGGMLRSTAGALRVDNFAMAELARLLSSARGARVSCGEVEGLVASGAVFDDDECKEGDPPSTELEQRLAATVPSIISRRYILQGGAVATGALFSGGAFFLADTIGLTNRAFAQTAYSPPAPQTPSDATSDSDTGEEDIPDVGRAPANVSTQPSPIVPPFPKPSIHYVLSKSRYLLTNYPYAIRPLVAREI